MAESAITQRMNIDPLCFSDKEIDCELARKKFLYFVKYVKKDYKPAWFHEKICDALQEWAFGEDVTRLMLFMPPQHGKSELASRNLPAWILGKNPEAKIISASYGFKLAKGMNRSVQRVMTSLEYKEVFPETRLFGKNVVTVAEDTFLKNSETFEVVGHAGSYMCTGVGGSVTGNTMTHGIIDDPIRGRKDAESAVIREGVHDWYDADFWTRQAGGNARILIMNTRWNEDDLSGYLLRLAEEDIDVDQWEVLSFPAQAVSPNAYDHRLPGQWLWPERYPERFYKAAKAKSDYDWQSLYQQNPHNDAYSIFKMDKIKDLLVDISKVDLSKCALYGALDPSKGGNDFAALLTIAVLPDGRWLVWECNLSVDVASTSIVKLVEAQQQYNYRSVWIEANAWEVAQSAWNKGQRSNFEIVLKQEQAKAGIVVPYIPVWHNKPKPDRIRSLEAHFNNGQLAFREDWAKCYRELINQFRIFPDKNAHDDGCFVKGTKVATLFGDKEIQDVRVGDLVITPSGVRKVLKCGLTGFKSVINKNGLIGTTNHPIFVNGKGFIPLTHISNASEVNKLCLTNQFRWAYLRSLYSMESNTDSWARNDIILANQLLPKGEGALKDFIQRSMSFIAARKFKKAISFITKTATHSITNIATLSAYHASNTICCTKRIATKNVEKLNFCQSQIKRRLGTNLMKVGRGIQNMLSRRGSERILNMFVSHVENRLNLGPSAKNTAPSIAGISDERTRVRSNSKPIALSVGTSSKQIGNPTQTELEKHAQESVLSLLKIEPVYNLTVEGEHVYFANHFLVSNCDAIEMVVAGIQHHVAPSTWLPPEEVPTGAEGYIGIY